MAAFVSQPIASGNENNFQPHRAFYKMALGTSKSTSGIVGVDGRMVFEWRSVCDGWVVEQRYLMRYQKEQGPATVTDTEYSTWESKDGKKYKFYRECEININDFKDDTQLKEEKLKFSDLELIFKSFK